MHETNTLQETTGNPCDIGTDPSIIGKEWPDLDFSQLDPVYPSKTGLYDPSEEALLKRASVAREWLFQRKEKFVIVVTHSGFLRRVVDGARYKNMEYRTYDFAERESPEDTLQLIEVDQGLPVKQEKALAFL